MDKDDPRRTLPIISAYKCFKPPFDIEATLRGALRVVPAKYVVGLDRVVLADATGLPRGRRRAKTYSRKRTVRIPEALGLYHQATRDRRAYIEIFVDNQVASGEGFGRLLHELDALMLASTLFHEIGHHIHFTKHPEQGEPERIAEKYQFQFTKRYSWRRAPVIIVYAIPFLFMPKFWRALPGFIRKVK